MDKNPDLLAQLVGWLMAHRAEFGYGTIAGLIAWLRGRYNERPFRRCFLDALMCAAIAFSVKDLLSFFSLTTDLAYIASVIIGYMGTDYLSSFLKWKVTGKNIEEEGRENDK
ncbi:phage holin [Yersinia rohdei]|uniref:phage holin, lambda family n=1 Tax=Yersinia rohdei TaxID=29485 RepID=UPI00061CB06F|nr:phage holin, lambda family [Yersinia rohdei]CNF16682.1 phage holin [Yersinia rohdei]